MPPSRTGPGCILLVIDESEGMSKELGGSEKQKQYVVSTAVNSFLRGLAGGPDFEIALIGYGGSGKGIVKSRWEGPLAGREFVAASELAGSELAIESRLRRSGGREEAVQFPVWYRPSPGGQEASQAAAFSYCKDLLEVWASGAEQGAASPIILHIMAGPSKDGPLRPVVARLADVCPASAPPMVWNVHLSSADAVTPNAYPSNRLSLPFGFVRELFEVSSALPDSIVQSLRADKRVVNPGARALVFNSQSPDLFGVFALIKSQISGWPTIVAQGSVVSDAQASKHPTAVVHEEGLAADAANSPSQLGVGFGEPATSDAEETPQDLSASLSDEELTLSAFTSKIDGAEPEAQYSPEDRSGRSTVAQSLLVLLVDVSPHADRAGQGIVNAANDLLTRIALRATGRIDVATVAYGARPADSLAACFHPTTEGSPTILDSDMDGREIRRSNICEELPNGAGGILRIEKTRCEFVQIPQDSGGDGLDEAIRATIDLVDRWTSGRLNFNAPPTVVHVSRDHFQESICALSAGLRGIDTAVGKPVLHHVVFTESGSPSFVFPYSVDSIPEGDLMRYWEESTLLLPSIYDTSSNPPAKDTRGLSVNQNPIVLVTALLESVGA